MQILAAITLLAGAWLIVAPYLLGYRGVPATNDLLVGALILFVSWNIATGPRARSRGVPSNGEVAAPKASESIDDMVRMLAGLPEEHRQALMRERLRLFWEMPEGQRKRAMREMIQAALRLPDDRLGVLVSTRTRVLSDLPPRQREALMETHMAALRELPAPDREREMRVVTQALSQLPPEKRAPLEKMMREI